MLVIGGSLIMSIIETKDESYPQNLRLITYLAQIINRLKNEEQPKQLKYSIFGCY
jgi:hypothetical protein